MPKIKPNPTEEANRIARACISSNMELYAVDEETLAMRIGITRRTIVTRREKPETFTLQELRKMAKTLKWTPVQAASVVLGRPLTSKEVKDFIMM